MTHTKANYTPITHNNITHVKESECLLTAIVQLTNLVFTLVKTLFTTLNRTLVHWCNSWNNAINSLFSCVSSDMREKKGVFL